MMTKIRVMLVDDEQELTQSLARVLGARGFAIEVVCSGRECLERLRDALPDVILLDLNMPGMDGAATLKEILKIDPHATVIVLSGHLDIALGGEVMRLGATEFLQKPCTVETLLAAIETAYERKAIHAEILHSNERRTRE